MANTGVDINFDCDSDETETIICLNVKTLDGHCNFQTVTLPLKRRTLYMKYTETKVVKYMDFYLNNSL